MNKRQDPVIRALEAEKRKLEKEIKLRNYWIYDYNPLQEQIKVQKDMREAGNQGDWQRWDELHKRSAALVVECDKYLRRDIDKLIDQVVEKGRELKEIYNAITLRQIMKGK